MALMFGMAGLPAHSDAFLHRSWTQREARKSVVLGNHLDWLLLHPDLHYRLRRNHLCADQSPEFLDVKGGLIGGNNMAAIHWRMRLG